MVLRINLAVFRTTDLALCFVIAGRFPAGVVVLNRNDLFCLDCKAVRCFRINRYLKAVFFDRITGRGKVNRLLAVFKRCANIAADPFKLIACGNEFASLWECKAEDIILRPANSVCTADHDFGNGLFRCFVATELALLPILAAFALPLVSVPINYFDVFGGADKKTVGGGGIDGELEACLGLIVPNGLNRTVAHAVINYSGAAAADLRELVAELRVRASIWEVESKCAILRPADLIRSIEC